MPKVIQFIKSKLELHRGKKSISSNPYSYRSNLKRKEKRVLNWTLDSFHLSPRCSSTYPLNFSFRKKSSAKETSKNFETKVNSISKFDNNIRFNSHARLIGASSAILLLSLLTLTVLPVVHNDETADAATGTATQSSTTVSVSTATASVDLTATSTDGTFATSTGSGIASFDVTTTNYTGYTLTIGADDDDGTLTNGSGGTFTSISSVMDEKTFDDSTYNGKWGYKPSKMNGVENVGFWPSPTTTATTLDTTKVANTTANTYTIALGARASASQAAGTYSKTVTITATSNPANYSITYKDDTSDSTVKNIPDATTSTTSGTSITLSSVTPSRTGYVFAGWCSVAPTSSGTVCSGTTYTAGGSYGIDQTTTNVVTLYALWANNSYGITINTATGIDSVSLNGTVCTSSCVVNNLEGGKSYVLTATPSNYYSFNGWTKTNASSTIADATKSITTYTVDGATDSITPSATTNGTTTVTVNYSYAGGGTDGAGSVTFTGVGDTAIAKTASGNGGTVQLKAGETYRVTTTPANTYGVKSYALNSASNGTLDAADTAHTYFTPNGNSATITVGTCIKTISGTMQTYDTNINYLCDDATGILTDSRDAHSYDVAVVIGNNYFATRTLWMTKNLSIGCNIDGTINSLDLDSSTSNLASGTYTTPIASGHSNTYTDGKIVCSNDTNYGAWYNYAAASAGTIATNGNNDDKATSSVCPKGWRLPSHSQISAATSNETVFSPVVGGYYVNGTIYGTNSGRWWSSDSNGGGTTRFDLMYQGYFLYTPFSTRFNGYYVRCVRN